MENPTTSEVLYQSIIAFFFLLVLARLLGKRQIAQLTFFDYIAGITIGNIAAGWSLDEVKSIHAILSLVVWTALSVILAFVQKKSYFGRIILDGRPKVLIENGKILERNLSKVHMSLEELELMLRQKDVFKLTDVEYAVFENNGTLSVMKKSEAQAVTRKDAGVNYIPEKPTRVLIIDGTVMQKSLESLGYTKEWLLGEVTKQGANDFRDVFCAEVDSNGNLYVDLYHDTLQSSQVNKKPLLAASLKKLQADMALFARETDNANAKQTYTDVSSSLQTMLKQLTPYLKE